MSHATVTGPRRATPPGRSALDIRPCGDAAVLVEVDDLDQALALHAALRAAPPAGLVDLVPAARSVLIRVRPGTDLRALEQAVLGLPEPAGATSTARTDALEIPVVYDGEDLPEVAEQLGRTVAEVVALHADHPWTVAFVGFAPGFGYLAGPPEWPNIARRVVPRTRVPAGAVALAGPYSGVYPRESPGGWQLIGRTELRTWDPDRSPPALLVPGTTVRFVPAGGPQ